MKRFVISMAMALLTSVGISVLMPGCNDDGGDPTGDEFRLTPSSAGLWKSGDAVVIQAVGGHERFDGNAQRKRPHSNLHARRA
jgi:hypothetical protein